MVVDGKKSTCFVFMKYPKKAGTILLKLTTFEFTIKLDIIDSGKFTF